MIQSTRIVTWQRLGLVRKVEPGRVVGLVERLSRGLTDLDGGSDSVLDTPHSQWSHGYHPKFDCDKSSPDGNLRPVIKNSRRSPLHFILADL